MSRLLAGPDAGPAELVAVKAASGMEGSAKRLTILSAGQRAKINLAGVVMMADVVVGPDGRGVTVVGTNFRRLTLRPAETPTVDQRYSTTSEQPESSQMYSLSRLMGRPRNDDLEWDGPF